MFAAGDRPENFYLWGAMGGAVPLSLGLALAQPDRSVVTVTGDGEQLMGLGALATVGAQQPPNLTIVVLDNGLYGETGRQRSHTALGTDLVTVAGGCGIAETLRDPGPEELAERIRARRATTFAQVRVEHGRAAPGTPAPGRRRQQERVPRRARPADLLARRRNSRRRRRSCRSSRRPRAARSPAWRAG